MSICNIFKEKKIIALVKTKGSSRLILRGCGVMGVKEQWGKERP